jgi:hypothetical protein
MALVALVSGGAIVEAAPVPAASALGLGALSATSWTVNTSGFPGTIPISGGTSPYSVFGASGLPTGLTAVVSGSSVVFTGTPTSSGPFSSGSVTVHDNVGGSATQTFSITINSAPGLGALSATSWTANTPGFPGTIPISGGTTPYSVFAASGLPTGLTAVVSGSSVAFTGTPTTPDVFSSGSVTVHDSAGASATQTFSITINSNCSSTIPVPGGNATVTSSAGTCSDVTSSAVPTSPAPPSGLSFPYGMIGFTINGLPAGGSTTVTVTLPGPVTQYWKLQNNAWHQLTGATFSGNQVTFTITDGGPEDADGNATNGTIVDPGAPAVTGALGSPAPAAIIGTPRLTG